MNIRLDGKTALVCGSTQGIGKAIAQQFAAAGAKVVCVARNKASLQETISQLSNPHEHSFLECDFDNPNQVRDVVMHFAQQGNTIDIIVNNSGGPAGGSLALANNEEFHTAMNRLILSAHEILKIALPHMKQQQFGRLINIISTSVKQPIENLGVSNTVRGATASWAKTLATELAPHGITVNNVLPGATATQRLESIIQRTMEKNSTTHDEVERAMVKEIPAGRFAQPEEIAYAATFLASNFASYITGTSLIVDGGRTRAL